MTRILSIGPDLDFVDSIDWNQKTNYKDYDIIFIDLSNLEDRSADFVHPYFEDEKTSVKFPTRKQVRSFVMEGGNDMIITLPSSSTIQLKENQNEIENLDEDEPTTYSCNVFAWLPMTLVTEDIGGKSVSLTENSHSNAWNWYFTENFSWDLTIQGVRQRSSMLTSYKNPKSGYGRYSSSGRNEKHGPVPRMQDIAVNASNECIASRIELFPRKAVDKSNIDQYPPINGGVYLFPLKPSIPFADFVRQVLIQNYEVLEEGLEFQPGWVEKYVLPEEQQLSERILKLKRDLAELEDQIEEPAKYKPLLYDVGDPLEELVRETLRDVGLDIDGEVPGKRDGIIKLDNQWVVLEIYGSINGVKSKKYRQLTDWVENVKVDNPDKNIEGLLIANTFVEADPNERPDKLLTGDPRRLMDQRGFHAISTIDIYRMICGYRNNELTTSDIKHRFANMDSLELNFEDVTASPV